MRRAVVQLAFFAVVILAGYLFFFKRDATVGLLQKGVTQARGYTPAKTPDEAVTKFRDAIRKRDYDVAATVYCGGDYAEQMRKGAKAATALGEAIDNLLYQMEHHDLDSEKVKVLLKAMEPFPTDVEFTNYRKIGDEKATYNVVEPNEVKYRGDSWFLQGKFDTKFFRALVRGFPQGTPVEVRFEGQGTEKAWKIYFPLTDDTRHGVTYLNDKYKTYVRLLEKLNLDVKDRTFTKAAFEGNVRTELETAARD